VKLFFVVCVCLMVTSCVTTYFSNDAFPEALSKVKAKTGDTLPIHREESYDWFRHKKGVHIDCKHF
jgi:hypothetical protein